MIRLMTVECAGVQLAATLHPADGRTGVVIVTGGVQTRFGAHRGLYRLAEALAAAGHPTLRFDRRGVGDSDGSDPGFANSAPDIAAAAAALRLHCPRINRVVGWGLCDGAAALAMHAPTLDLAGLILANPWTVDASRADPLPPRAAIAVRYRERLRDPRAWARLLRGGIDLRKAARGLAQLARREPTSATARAMAAGLAKFSGRSLVLLSGRDATAQAFRALWDGTTFAPVRRAGRTLLVSFPDAGHTFARADDAAAVAAACSEWLSTIEALAAPVTARR